MDEVNTDFGRLKILKDYKVVLFNTETDKFKYFGNPDLPLIDKPDIIAFGELLYKEVDTKLSTKSYYIRYTEENKDVIKRIYHSKGNYHTLNLDKVDKLFPEYCI